MPNETSMETLTNLAHKIRIHSVTCTTAPNSGHPTTSSSCAEILAVLFFHTMKYKVCSPRHRSSDRFVLSKGHAAPALYGVWVENKFLNEEELLNVRSIGSDLEGHPTPRLKFIDVGTGSLGQGLSVAAGMAYTGKHFDIGSSYRVYCLIGDGECAEGSVWESLHFASFYKLDNLCMILDCNRLGQTGPTSIGHDLHTYQVRFEAFGWFTIIVDGHNVSELTSAFEQARNTYDKPTAIIAKTFKGKHFPGIEDQLNWHGKALGDKSDEVLRHLESLLTQPGPYEYFIPPPNEDVDVADICNVKLSSPPTYNLGEVIATRKAYGTALSKLDNDRVAVLDGDMRNSTYSEDFMKIYPERFVESYIMEQNLVGVAIGVACRDRMVVFLSTFAAFLTRAFDQIRMGAVSQSNINICGSHCGCSIGEDGASQMGLEDLAMFRSIPQSTVFYPFDAVAAEKAVELAANTKGIAYIRTGRPPKPVIYTPLQDFQIGKAIVLKESNTDRLLFIGGGITLYEGLNAEVELAKIGINMRCLDLFTIKPIDKIGIVMNARACGGRILVVEDHYYEGGIGEAVLSAVAEESDITVKHVAVARVPHSGTTNDVLKDNGLHADCIVEYAKKLLN